MVNRIITIVKNNFEKLKILSVAFSTVFLKSFVNLVIVKLVSYFAGPSALALFSQMLSVNAITSNLTTASVTTGVVKLSADYKTNDTKLNRLKSTILKLNIFLGVVLFIGFFLFKESLSKFIFGSDEYGIIVALIGFSSTFSGLNLIFLSLANGLKLYRDFLIINVISSVTLLLFISVSNFYISITNYMIAYLSSQVFAIFFLIRKLYILDFLRLRYLKDGIFDISILKRLSQFAIMSFSATILVNSSQIIVRSYLGEKFSLEQAGLWDAMIKFSTSYFAIITAGLGIYFLPKIAESHGKNQIESEVKSIIKLIFPAMVILFLLMFFLREPIILLLYSKEFLSIENYFLPILISDTLKWFAWIFSYVIMAKSYTKLFIINEVLVTLILILSIMLFSQLYGFVGVFYAYISVFLWYLISSYFFYNKVIRNVL